MKKIIISTLFSVVYVFCAAQSESDIFGEWFNEEKDAVVTIYKDGNSISGKTTWLKEPLDSKGNAKLDLKNPDEKLRSRKRMGLKIMHSFKYNDQENIWEDGRIYDPKKGKLYGGTATLVNENELKLKGYIIGMPLLGRTATWTRKTN